MRGQHFTAESRRDFGDPPTAKGRARLSSARRGPCVRATSESQRDSGLQPRVARNELPWVTAPSVHNPNGVAAGREPRRSHPDAVGERPPTAEARPLTAGARAARPQVRPEVSETCSASQPISRGRRSPTTSTGSQPRVATPLGLKPFPTFTQGSSFLATQGWRPQSRWDCSARPDSLSAAHAPAAAQIFPARHL